MIKYAFKFILVFSIGVFALVSYQRPVLATTYPSELYKSCAEVCDSQSEVCDSITTSQTSTNNKYCKIDEEEGGGDYCREYSGDCYTVLTDDGFGGCSRGDINCTDFPLIQAMWTDCRCIEQTEWVSNCTRVGDIKCQQNEGVPDYFSATSSPDFINSYQPFDSQLDGGTEVGQWSTITNLNLKLMTVLGGDTNLDIFLKMTTNGSNCDGDEGIDWVWHYYNSLTVESSGTWLYYDILPDGESVWTYPDNCSHYGDIDWCSVCGIGIRTDNEEGITWTQVGSLPQVPGIQLDISNERVANYPMYFLLSGSLVEPGYCEGQCTSDNIIYYGVCASLCWLFVPTDYGLDSFTNNYENLKTTFPFSTYFQLTTAIQDGIENSGINTDNTIGVPMVRDKFGSPQYYILPVISSSTLPNAVGGANANAIRNGLSTIIWLVAAGVAVILFIKL